MINLEWLRTFRAVYKTKSLSKASELLNISQPTISHHISTLEAHVGQKLFIRKSKGVIETDEGRMLNNMSSGALSVLEEVEFQIVSKSSPLKCTITIGISEHLYKTYIEEVFFELGEHVHISYGTRSSLIKDVEEGRLLYAIIPEETNTFDLINDHLIEQNLVLVATPDLNLDNVFDNLIENSKQIEKVLTKQTWFAHDTNSNYIKLFWIAMFDKKRPSIVPSFVVPNEYEVLNKMNGKSGVSVALEHTAQKFEKEGKLKIVNHKPIFFRNLSLISNKSRARKEISDKIQNVLMSPFRNK